MRKSVIMVVLVAALAATPAAGATNEEFTGSFAYGPGHVGELSDGVEGRWVQGSPRWTDPRFEGEVVLSKLYWSDPLGSLEVEGVYASSFRITNEAGAWQSRPEVGFFLGALSDSDNPEEAASTIYIFDGEGEYAGNTALIELSLSDGFFTAKGRVFEGVLGTQP